MKDLVDFNSREDFESYMRSLENGYFDQMGMSKPPYEQIPSFPPKPYQKVNSTNFP